MIEVSDSSWPMSLMIQSAEKCKHNDRTDAHHQKPFNATYAV